MRARIWGCRGSLASPGAETARYGGNTSCVEVRADDGTVVVLDAGMTELMRPALYGVLGYGAAVRMADAIRDLSGTETFDYVSDLLRLKVTTTNLDRLPATGRCVVVHEATRTNGFGAELAALVHERCFYHLEAPVQRATGFDTPYPHSLEWAYFPGPVRIGTAIRKTLEA